MEVNETRFNQLLEQVLIDIGAAYSAPLVLLGEKLGLYKALADGGPQTSLELAARTGLSERYIREWLRAQAASRYVNYEPDVDSFYLSKEQKMMFADENSPAYIPSSYQVALSAHKVIPRLEQAFQSGEGISWCDHDHGVFHGTERFFRAGYQVHLVDEWLPALDGVVDRLREGARVADVGCGHGASTIIMARAFPNATFTGFDFHPESIRIARQRAREAGVADRIRFEVATAKSFEGGPYDLVTLFDCLHDMGDPVGGSRHIRSQLKPDGVLMIVEPFANDRLEDNISPVGRIFYSASTMICTPSSMDQEVGLALGAQAGEMRIRQVVESAGFERFRRATETPFNLVFEARP